VPTARGLASLAPAYSTDSQLAGGFAPWTPFVGPVGPPHLSTTKIWALLCILILCHIPVPTYPVLTNPMLTYVSCAQNPVSTYPIPTHPKLTYISYANISHANISCANISHANVTCPNISGAKHIQCPDMYISHANISHAYLVPIYPVLTYLMHILCPYILC
jgi:hypothetical protein